MGRRFTGATGNASGGVILGAPFWEKGTKIMGVYFRSFETRNGQCHAFMCASPAVIEVFLDKDRKVVAKGTKDAKVEKISQFSMGSMAGFEMAIQDAASKGFSSFQVHDKVTIECTGHSKNVDRSLNDMVEFAIEVEQA